MVRRFGRWLIAVVVVFATFAVSTAVAGLWVLPLWMKSESDRWAVSGAVGVALAALAALWGFSFANGESSGSEDAETGGSRSVSVSGDNSGQISTGDNSVNIQRRP